LIKEPSATEITEGGKSVKKGKKIAKELEERVTAFSAGKEKSSIEKVKEVSRLILGQPVDEAIRQLTVNKRKPAKMLLSLVKQAKSNAKHMGIKSDNLIVSHTIIERKSPIRLLIIRGRGRAHMGQRRAIAVKIFVQPAETLKGKEWEWRRKEKLVKERFKSWMRGELNHEAPKIEEPKPEAAQMTQTKKFYDKKKEKRGGAGAW